MTTYNVSNLDNNANIITVTSTGPQGADAVLQAGNRGDFTVAIAGNGTQTATINTGAVTSDKILNGTILDTDINSAANINGSKLLNDSVGLTKLGSGALPSDISVSSTNIVNGTIVNEDIATGTLDGRYYTETELDAGQLDNRYFTETELNNGELDNRYFTETELNAGQLDTRYFTETELNNGQLDNRYFTETELNAGQLDNRYYTEAEADARFYNLASAEEIQSGETWVTADNKVATTAAIDARIIDLVDDVGGFVPIANELSFPNSNPDINNGTGTLVSIKALSTAYTSNSSGAFTIGNGTVGNSTVTITGATASTTFAAGFGMILETTSTLNTYTFHRLVPKATEVTTVASKASEITTVVNNITPINTVNTNITSVQAVANKATQIGLLGTSDAIADMAILGTADVVADMNLLATTDIVADMALLAVSSVITDLDILATTSNVNNMSTLANISANITTAAGISSDITTVANDGTDIGTVAGISGNVTTVAGISSNVTTVANDGTDIGLVAGSITNVNTTAGSISSVNTVAGSISNVNEVASNLAALTDVSSILNKFLGNKTSNPTTDNAGLIINQGDFYYNTNTDQFRVYNGYSWSVVNIKFNPEHIPTSGFSDDNGGVHSGSSSTSGGVVTYASANQTFDLGSVSFSSSTFPFENEERNTRKMSLSFGSNAIGTKSIFDLGVLS
jgi:hypothetical protein|tara:strand:- start:3044 stop:5107 length:2064 start_codon:yes stop_codon:yes gene_type:complete